MLRCRKVKGALTYPSSTVKGDRYGGWVMTVLAVPQVKGLYKDVGRELLILTQLMVRYRRFLHQFLVAVSVGSTDLVSTSSCSTCEQRRVFKEGQI